MNNDAKKQWLAAIRLDFCENEPGAIDFFYILETMIGEARFDLPDLVANAAQGRGCVVREGLMYSLDQDWDNPEEFDQVTFFVGDLESSTLPIDRYISLLRAATLKYVEHFPDCRESVLQNLRAAERRYVRVGKPD